MENLTFEDILTYSGFDYLPYEHEVEDTYFIKISYTNTITLGFISTFVADLSNNGFNVFTEIEDNTVSIKAIENLKNEEINKVTVENSGAAYYQIQKWVDKLNRKLEDLEVAVEKEYGLRDYTKRNMDTKKYERGRYGGDSMFYIINPEINQKELLYIVDFLLEPGHLDAEELRPEWFTRDKVQSVMDSPFLQSLGYSDNETFLRFPIFKQQINFDPTSNLGR